MLPVAILLKIRENWSEKLMIFENFLRGAQLKKLLFVQSTELRIGKHRISNFFSYFFYKNLCTVFTEKENFRWVVLIAFELN